MSTLDLQVKIIQLTQCLREIKEFCQDYPINDDEVKNFNPMDDYYQIGCRHGEEVLAGSILNIIDGHELKDI